MALGINTNVASINAQNQMSKSQSMNDQALERLSSGLRINSAKDDAAGLAISTRFDSQITGLETASRNSNDGISLAQTAEGALDEITNNLQRVRELSVQSANATNNASDREALDDEVQQRIEEIDRIADTTAFNGLNVLDGNLGVKDFQVGANAGETIEFDLSQGAKSDQIGEIASADVNFADVASGGNPSFSGGGSFKVAIGDGDAKTIDVSEGDSAANIAESIESENLEGVDSVSASSKAEIDFTSIDATTSGGTYSVDIGLGDDVETISVSGGSGGISADAVAAAIEEDGPEGLSVAESGGSITLEADSGENITLDNETFGGDLQSGGGSSGFGVSGATYVGNVEIDSSETIRVDDSSGGGIVQSVNDDTAASGGETTVDVSGSLEGVDVTSVPNANDSIKRADAALNTVNEIRSGLGAVQNRFESTIANLDNNVENLEASNSRIKDADFAAESAKLSQSQVLQQAGISVLSQANQRPQQVLSLLQ